MANETNGANQSDQNGKEQENNDQQKLPLHNPLNPDDPRKITPEEIENEQKYKEAFTERD